ncbi:hypothetical protein L208DRAFT_1374420 [Tricholoma matsutake]|nr:hypothetical protein L208DRAFT_1374420 [Tricholoma matsutake 945]
MFFKHVEIVLFVSLLSASWVVGMPVDLTDIQLGLIFNGSPMHFDSNKPKDGNPSRRIGRHPMIVVSYAPPKVGVVPPKVGVVPMSHQTMHLAHPVDALLYGILGEEKSYISLHTKMISPEYLYNLQPDHKLNGQVVSGDHLSKLIDDIAKQAEATAQAEAMAHAEAAHPAHAEDSTQKVHKKKRKKKVKRGNSQLGE